MLDWVSATGALATGTLTRPGLGAGQRLVGQLGGEFGRAPVRVGLDVERDDIEIVAGEHDALQDPQAARMPGTASAVIRPPPAR